LFIPFHDQPPHHQLLYQFSIHSHILSKKTLGKKKKIERKEGKDIQK